MAHKCLLFVYGLLMPPSPHAPRSVSAAWPDRIRARLVQLEGYPGAVGVGAGEEWVEGVTLEIDADELPGLDLFEDVEGGEYVRRTVETEQGHLAWVYEYTGPLP